MAHVVIKVARNAGIVALFVVAAMLGILSGVLFAYAGDLPRVSALDDYMPSTITRISSASGQVIGEFATQRRVVVGYDDINPLLRQAIIATEDAEFDRHFGVNIWRIARRGRRSTSSSAAARRAPARSRSSWRATSRSSSASRTKKSLRAQDPARSSSPSRSRSGTRSARSSRSTATRCTSGTAPTASRPRRACTSTSRTSS